VTPIRPSEAMTKFSCRANPHLYEINTLVWCEELSAKLGRLVTLETVPDGEWDRLRSLGFDFIYLMGVWRRSQIGRRIFRTDAQNFHNFDTALPNWKVCDIVGSPFSIRDYSPDPRISTPEGLSQLHHQLRKRGMGLILDFVPNHTGFDHGWIAQHPERYVQGSEADFHRDAAPYFLVERDSGENLFIARGRDPYFPPWSDVAQLNYFNPDCRAAMIGVLKNISQYCDGVRCDMAMLVTNEIFQRTWGPLLTKWPAPPTEFWPEAIAAVPDFVWLAEVYWDMEWRMQELGFQFTYDKRLYDRARDSSPGDVRAHLNADLRYQNKLARFLENHDEPRSAAVFPREKIPALATLFSTLPGMRFYHHGQLGGKKIFVPMPLAKAQFEDSDPQIRELYEGLLHFSDAEVFHNGEWKLLDIQPAEIQPGEDTYNDLIAYGWRRQSELRLIVLNLGNRVAQGRVLDATWVAGSNYSFHDIFAGNDFSREGSDLARNGLYVSLNSYQARAFEVREN